MGRPSLICGVSEPWPVRIPRVDVWRYIQVGPIQMIVDRGRNHGGFERRLDSGCSPKNLVEFKTIQYCKDGCGMVNSTANVIFGFELT